MPFGASVTGRPVRISKAGLTFCEQTPRWSAAQPADHVIVVEKNGTSLAA
jgi:hypothetical protein